MPLLLQDLKNQVFHPNTNTPFPPPPRLFLNALILTPAGWKRGTGVAWFGEQQFDPNAMVLLLHNFIPHWGGAEQLVELHTRQFRYWIFKHQLMEG